MDRVRAILELLLPKYQDMITTEVSDYMEEYYPEILEDGDLYEEIVEDILAHFLQAITMAQIHLECSSAIEGLIKDYYDEKASEN
jgi:hypothetical protein